VASETALHYLLLLYASTFINVVCEKTSWPKIILVKKRHWIGLRMLARGVRQQRPTLVRIRQIVQSHINKRVLYVIIESLPRLGWIGSGDAPIARAWLGQKTSRQPGLPCSPT
jgi:hypothetical protein